MIIHLPDNLKQSLDYKWITSNVNAMRCMENANMATIEKQIVSREERIAAVPHKRQVLAKYHTIQYSNSNQFVDYKFF